MQKQKHIHRQRGGNGVTKTFFSHAHYPALFAAVCVSNELNEKFSVGFTTNLQLFLLPPVDE